MLRVWQTASSQGPYETLTLWQAIKSKVMVVKWHPSKEGLLAFGADDGQVGVYNTISKRAEISATYHKKTVYSLSWGPPCPKTDENAIITHNLYSCAGDGRVYQHRTGHFMEDPVDVCALIVKTNDIKHKPLGRTDVSWNLDGTVMALGNEDGSIEVFVPPDLMQIGLIMTHKKSITTLVWHHGYSEVTTSDVGSCKYWLASGSNEFSIHVHDLSSVLGDLSNPRPRAAPITDCFRQLSGHWGRITGLSWSPHQSELLLSSSYDGTAQVWDVPKGEPLFNFRGHSSRVMCVVWSYLDPDLVYSGGEDGTVRPWRPSVQQHRQPPVQEKKMTHSSSKSSAKNKRAKQKAKLKTESIDNEACVQEKKLDHDGNPGGNTKELKVANERPTVAETITLIGNTDNALTSEQNGGVLKSENRETEMAAPAEVRENVEKKSSPDAKSVNTRGLGEVETLTNSLEVVNLIKNEGVNLSNGHESEKKQEAIIPLRSRVTLEPSLSLSTSSKKKKKAKSMFPVSAVADNKSKLAAQDECVQLAEILYGQDDSNSSPTASLRAEAGSDGLTNLGLFADRRAAYRLIATEGQHHKENGNLDYRLQLEIWKGNLAGALEMATTSKQLTDWLVALSPLAGRNVWMATTRAFADQLESQGSYQRAVLYYLACHDTYKAIDVFRKQGMYREAIALAKVRLSPLDPVLFDLYSAWARKLETENSFEQAAKCYLAVKSSAEAVRVLVRRGDQPSLKTAFQVSLLSGETELAISLSLRLTQSCLIALNWKEAQEILTSCPGAEAHLLNVCVHELLIVTLSEEQIITDDFFHDAARTKISSFLHLTNLGTREPVQLGKYLYVDTPYESPWIANSKPGKWFIASILQAWYDSGVFQPHSTLPLLNTLKAHYETISFGTETISESLSELSIEITLGLLGALIGDLYTACQYWLQALSSCSKKCLFALQRQLCFMLLPNGLRSLNNLLSLSHELCGLTTSDRATTREMQEQLFRHFDAYYAKALITELWYRFPKAITVFHSDSDKSFGEDDNNCLCEPEYSLDNYKFSDSNELKSEQEVAAVIIFEGDEHNEVMACAEKELFSSRKSDSGRKEDLMSTLQKFSGLLLSDRHARLCNLRSLLTEIRKAMLLMRSRQFVTGKSLSRKKKKSKIREQMVQPVGITANCSECELTNGTFSVNSAVKPTENGGEGHEEADEQGSGENEDSFTADKSQEEASPSEITTKGLVTHDGKLPIDLRFTAGGASVDGLQDEETRVLKELKEDELKDLPFPSPLESALIVGNFCVCANGLPISAADLQEIGMSVVSWAQIHAQTLTDLKGVLRLKHVYGKIPAVNFNNIINEG